jgi:tripartite-type tricarboxylate transporter receptor subunit TctC
MDFRIRSGFFLFVMARLDRAIHTFAFHRHERKMDSPVKPGHDGGYRLCALVVGVFACAALPVFAQAADDGFYAGKQIRVIVGFPPGGGFDSYARTLADHMGRHVPGNPTLIVQNMPGATTAKAAAHIYGVAPQDGTVIGLLHQGLLANQVLDIQGGAFDVTKFNWIGRMGTRLSVGLVWHTTGVKTIEDAKKKEIIMGATSPTATSAMVPLALNHAAGTKFKVVMGYQGSADMYLAMERGETHGLPIAGWLDLIGPRADWVKDGKVAVLYQIALKRHPDLPNIPVLTDLANNDVDRQILALLASTEDMGRSFVSGPNLPAARVDTLRRAFADMMADPVFLADAQKRQLDIDFMDGKDLQALVQNVGAFPPDIAAKAKQILKPSAP